MQKKYGIILTLSLFAFLTVLFFGYREEYKYLERKTQMPSSGQTENTKSDALLQVQGTAQKEEQQSYYLTVLNGYVVVFLSDRQTLFEYTDIPLTDLPTDLQDELKKGKMITGEEKLYGFLENYSS